MANKRMNNPMELVEAVKQFEEASAKLAEVWSRQDAWSEEVAGVLDDYPFPVSFDELNADVSLWEEAVVERTPLERAIAYVKATDSDADVDGATEQDLIAILSHELKELAQTEPTESNLEHCSVMTELLVNLKEWK